VKLYVEKNAGVWNKLVESSPYAVWHQKYEALKFDKGKHGLPLVFEKNGDYLLFPFALEGFLGFQIASIPVNNLASVLPSGAESFPLIPMALDCAVDFLKSFGVDFLRMSGPFFMPEEYRRLLDTWFEGKKALTELIFVDALDVQRKSFEEIWMKGFSKHARNRARKADKEGVSVREIERFDEWISDMHLCNMSSFSRQKRYPRYPHSDKEAFLIYLNRHKAILGENYRVYGAFFRNRLIAYMATLEFSGLIVIGLLMSLSNLMSKCPNDALLRYLVDHACESEFSWIYYSFDRVSYSSKKPSLHSSLRRFKFEHGFKEYPMKIYHLGLTNAGGVLQRFTSLYNFLFVASTRLPNLMTDSIQKIYERQRYKKSRYSYISEFLNQRKTLRANSIN